ncbi:hypothetical protein [Laspinema palackyanum]
MIREGHLGKKAIGQPERLARSPPGQKAEGTESAIALKSRVAED